MHRTREKMLVGTIAVLAALLVATVGVLIGHGTAQAVALAGSGNAEMVGDTPCQRLDISTTAANIDIAKGRYQVTASTAAAFLLGSVDPEAPASCTSGTKCGVEIPAGVPMEIGTDAAVKLRAVAVSGTGRLNVCPIRSGRAG